MLCSALKQTFSSATAQIGTGHITRSSISRVMPNSLESGSATAAIPLNMIATAINPGSRIVPKLPPDPAAPPIMIGLPPAIRGMMKVKTKRNSSGCIPTRSTNGSSSRLSTRRSRRYKPQKAFRKEGFCSVWILLTQVPPRQMDKDRLQAGFGDRDIAQAQPRAGLDHLGQHAIRAAGEDPQPLRRNFGAGHALPKPQIRSHRFRRLKVAQLQADDRIRTVGAFQLLRRTQRQQLAPIHNRYPLTQLVRLFHV